MFKSRAGFSERSLARASNGCLQLYPPTIWVFMFYNSIPLDWDWRATAPLTHFPMMRTFLIMEVIVTRNYTNVNC